ncbi:MAG: hypothetical protein JNG83_12905 [Opitutaceae bacterium]|nr:hypothetical protein [Opitutaceae bacterium]
MKKWLGGCLGLVLALAAGGADPARPAPPPTLDRLAWLAGKWRFERAGRVSEEHWMAPAGGLMLGMARTVSRGKVLGHEFLQIREGPGGMLFLVARPSGQTEVTFPLATMTDRLAVFENLQHDFPQRIGYEQLADGGLLAYLEGLQQDGGRKRVEFSYRRVEP